MSFAGLSLRDIEYCVAVADTGSFSRAAEACRVAQPSLSVQVGKLEARLKVTLFERTRRRVVATTDGLDVIEQMRVVLREAARLDQFAARSPATLRGHLHLSAISTLGPYLFPAILQGLRLAYDGVTFILGEGRTGNLLDALRGSELDAVLVALPVNDPHVVGSALFAERFLLACPPGHRACLPNGSGWAGLAPGERLLLEDGHCLRDHALLACDEVGIGNRHGTSLETLKYMIAAGEGCTLMPALAAAPAAGIDYLELEGEAYRRTIGLVHRSTDPRQDAFARLAADLRDGIRKAGLDVSVTGPGEG